MSDLSLLLSPGYTPCDKDKLRAVRIGSQTKQTSSLVHCFCESKRMRANGENEFVSFVGIVNKVSAKRAPVSISGLDTKFARNEHYCTNLKSEVVTAPKKSA
jgi:hypothetical protein